MRLINDLKQLGLDEKEAKVYLAALELGPTNIQDLTKKSQIKRSTVYEMIKNLKEMGLISETTKHKRKLIVASEPENIKRNLVAKEKLLNQLMPELKGISNIGFVKPKMTFYEGKEGLREIYWDALNVKKNEMALWVSPIKSVMETVGEDFLNKYIAEKAKRGLWVKSIHIFSEKVPTYKYLAPETYDKTLRKVRFTPPVMDISNTIVIYGSKVSVISSRKEGFGFVVESEDYANTMRIFYDLLWNISKPYGEMTEWIE